MDAYTPPPRTAEPTDRAKYGLADDQLADIAIRIQLSPTKHRLATERYEALGDWIKRPDSPLDGRVQRTYPQGSMRIGATITSRITHDEFDIDAVTQLALPVDTAPRDVLDTLFEAVRGKPGSRYHDLARRRSRCVTVSYKGGMHVDLTPAIRQLDTCPRQSWIFEHRTEKTADPGHSLIANPYGFAEWFVGQLPDDHHFEHWFQDRTEAHEESLGLASAEPVPAPEPVGLKSRAVVALQLLKRWRNVQYEERAGRRPPSVVLSKLVGDTATSALSKGPGLLDVLLYLAEALHAKFGRVHATGELICILNPVCHDDVLTDRWPHDLQTQAMFIDDLENLVGALRTLRSARDTKKIRDILVALFGEAPASEPPSVEPPGRGPRRVTSKGGMVVGGTVAAGSGCRTVPRHTFHGDGSDGL